MTNQDKVGRIVLTQGKIALIDKKDFSALNKHKWYAFRRAKHTAKSPDKYTVCRKVKSADGKWKQTYMARVILNAPPDKFVDHINGNPLDNRRKNIRICTPAENARNKERPNKYGYMGFHWNERAKKYQAQLICDGKRHSLGYHKTIIEAAKAYNRGAKKYFGKFAKLNKIPKP